MIIGKDLYGLDGILLLKEGQRITEMNINRIQSLGFQGIYIVDKISEDINIQNIIDDTLRQRAIGAVKHIFNSLENKEEKKAEINLLNAKNFIEDIVDEIINKKHLIINMVDLKYFDDYTYYHCVNVAVLSIVVGFTLGLSREDLWKLGLGAMLHDIGKVFILKDILNKRGSLTEEEIAIVQGHSEKGYDYLREKWEIPIKSYIAVLFHHERYNGTGYPRGREKENIQLFSRVIAIADVYDALISDRPYRKAVLPSDAIEYIMGASGLFFDPELVRIFVRKVAPYPLGSCVKLSNGETGIVVGNYEDACLRPKLRLLHKEKEDIYLDLKNDPESWNVTIVENVVGIK
jgi:HD-GYP domain-containing protein (c-di-GMP phosphodiesterase class II)